MAYDCSVHLQGNTRKSSPTIPRSGIKLRRRLAADDENPQHSMQSFSAPPSVNDQRLLIAGLATSTDDDLVYNGAGETPALRQQLFPGARLARFLTVSQATVGNQKKNGQSLLIANGLALTSFFTIMVYVHQFPLPGPGQRTRALLSG